MAVETIALVAMGVSAAAGTGVAIASHESAQKQRKAQESLVNERKAQLAAEARERAGAQAKMATSGRRVGASTRSTFASVLAPQPGSGAASVTGTSGGAPSSGRATLFGN